ncbi:hypothetical protein DFJ73DRAFT_861165 [Zopfochytrium polystomum]|nr:hypothetical protein DFJ73DRAFT_871506 [Zopfochytrium polystomum]KAI9329039.1 hypothetical protein DFJ73DRAFT_861165 [Zopfochytrium polystomum]
MSAELPRSAAQQEHPVQSGLAAVSPSSFGGSVILAGALNLTSVTAGATAASLTSSSQDLTSRTVLVLVLLAAVLLTYVTFIVPKLTTAYKTLFAAADDGILGLLHMPCTTDDTGLEDGFAQVEEGCAVVGAAGRSDVGGRGKTGRRAEERNHYGLIRKEAEAAREGLLFAGASTGEEEEP